MSARREVCVKCQKFFKIKRNGVLIEEGMPYATGQTAAEQPKDETAWKPYKLFVGDLYECEGCGALLAKMNRDPIAEHFQPQYDVVKQRYRERGLLLPMVEDC